MFPWNSGFHWSAANIIFLGAFYTVLVIVATTLVSAAVRSRRAMAEHAADRIRWHAVFEELPARDRTCRHVLTGELSYRLCPNAFDCRVCETHAKVVATHPPAPAGDEEDMFGLSYPLDRFYHRGHTWARPEPDGTIVIGLDELGARLMDAPDAIEFPEPGTRLCANGTAWRMRKRNASVRTPSPVDGEVVEIGSADRGWYLRVKPLNGSFDLRHLLRGGEIRPWVLRELERLQLALSTSGVPALADGGVPVADIASSYPEADWDAVCGEMFLQG